jgi:hypothetical protein
MAGYQINAFELIKQTFGITGYIPVIEGKVNPELDYEASQIKTIKVAESTATSSFGTPIYESLTLIRGDKEYKFLDAPLMDVNRSKHIISSKVQGIAGNVHEVIGDEDFIVRIRGVLVNEDEDDLPHKKIEELKKWLDYNEAIKVESRLLNLHGINNLIFRKPNFPASDKFVNVQPYVLDCISDNEIELIIL